MTRVHAFEFNEAPWFPSVLRDIITDSLQFGAERMAMYEPAIPVLAELLSLAKQADPDAQFEWNAGRAAPSGFGPAITWLTGRPRD